MVRKNLLFLCETITHLKIPRSNSSARPSVVVRYLVLDVADVEEGGEQLHDVPDLVVGEGEHLAGGADVGELDGVVAAVARDALALAQVLEVARVRQAELAPLLRRQAHDHAVEDVVVALVLRLVSCSRMRRAFFTYSQTRAPRRA